MTTATRFEDLDVWQNAKELTNLIYRLSAAGSFARDFGLRDQMRRAAVSIMSNIAEGFAGELRAQLYIALEQKYRTDDEFQSAFSLAEICSRQLASFIQYLESQPNARRVQEEGVHYDIQP
jgi:hypothetical protein